MDGAEAVEYILKNNIPGVLIECGVHEGAQPMLWIQKLLEYGCTDRDIYLYDTFTGMTEPGKEDYSVPGSLMYNCPVDVTYHEWEKNQRDTHNEWCYGSLQLVKDNLYKFPYPKERIHFIQGDVCKTLQDPSYVPDKIALLRMDTDWYESSKAEMDYLYPKVIPGGMVIMDDYFHWNGQRKATDDYLKLHNISCSITRVNAKVGAFIKPNM
jgi:hypothetical protein